MEKIKLLKIQILVPVFAAILFLFGGCEDINNIEKSDDITFELLINSNEFNNFLLAFEEFNTPFVSKISKMKDKEFELYNKELNQLLSAIDIDEDSYSNLILKMGYTNLNQFENLFYGVNYALNELSDQFPELNRGEFNQFFQEALEIYFKYIDISYSKAATSFNLQMCLDLAFADYLFRTAGCVALAGLHPFAALACQIANSSLYSSAQLSCYEQNIK